MQLKSNTCVCVCGFNEAAINCSNCSLLSEFICRDHLPNIR